MLDTAGRYLVMDSYTKGLDSAASLDIVRSMKTAARHLGATIIATQYQISKVPQRDAHATRLSGSL